jgi:hypothetical protein
MAGAYLTTRSAEIATNIRRIEMTAALSTLCAHVGADYKTREQLKDIVCPEPTKSWKPVPHFDLVTTLIESLAARGIAVMREQYAVGGAADTRLFATFDLAVPDFTSDGQTGMALGLRTANDKAWLTSMMAAARVFLCDNMAFSGDDGAVFLKRKHTSRWDIGESFGPAIDLYLEKSGRWAADMDRMRNFSLPDASAKAIIYDAFMGDAPIMPIRMIDDVHRLYFRDEHQAGMFPERNLWNLNNAFTEGVKQLKANPQAKAGLEIGRYFAGLLERRDEFVPTRLAMPYASRSSTLSYLKTN